MPLIGQDMDFTGNLGFWYISLPKFVCSQRKQSCLGLFTDGSPVHKHLLGVTGSFRAAAESVS